MKKLYKISTPLLLFFILISSCVNSEKDTEYIKKRELNQETIAVGIYKATEVDYVNISYIAEALKIDGGIVYVTLTDADILKTKLENIDVIIFPSIEKGQIIDLKDDEITEIFKKFISKKGAIGLCNGCRMLLNSPDCQTIDVVDLKLNETILEKSLAGRISFNLNKHGEKIFPELKDYKKLYIDYCSGYKIEVTDTINGNKILGSISDSESFEPLFITSKYKSGKIMITNTHPETTPGMRWMLPRMVRWVYNKKFISYNKKVFRPDLYSTELFLDDEKNEKIEKLLIQLDNGKKNEILAAMDELQNIYPWLAAEKVRSLLIEKNNDIKIRAAKYLVDIEYTLVIDDLRKLIKNERSKKVKEQLIAFLQELDSMIEQN
ncbi:MAG: hypothetical protein KOO66_08685 [Bacteroidales bacterium]|nr:hypothetical protein [Bacteroidales bacterium]